MSTSEEVSGLAKRTAGDADKAPIVRIGLPPIALGDIGANAVRRPHELAADRILSQRLPFGDNIPQKVSELLRRLVDAQALKRRAH